MVHGDGRSVSEVYVLTVTCDAVYATVGCCVEYIPHVLTSLADFYLYFLCVCGGFIYGDLLPLGYVMFVHDVALMLC